jgi:uncharacterized glyoxalase superfamily metalloenzyme YdcJ
LAMLTGFDSLDGEFEFHWDWIYGDCDEATMMTFADKTKMQNRLFAELSDMFGREVPLYDKALLVNKACNKTVCALLGQLHIGFSISDSQLDKTSGERHGAIRIGKPSEYRWVAGLFAAFGLEPHNYYDMTKVGNKSQPIVATAFRSPIGPEHRVFCSLLMTDYFDPETRERIEALLKPREVFSARAQELIVKNQKQGGLSEEDAAELVREGVTRIFKWTGRAKDYGLYEDLCKAGFKIAADIACFESHHLNHLTPNTFWMDLYTNAMKFCLGEMDAATHSRKAERALERLQAQADKDYLRLHFKHLSYQAIEDFGRGEVAPGATRELAEKLTRRLQEPDLDLSKLKHAGFKDFTEGPPEGTPVLLRQDSYKALTEPVIFQQPDGTTVTAPHTARFGEIEQRFYATTTTGRELYDKCLAAGEVAREKNPGLIKQDYDAYLKVYADCFAPFPKTLPELLEQKLVYGRFTATAKGIPARGSITSVDLMALAKEGHVRYEGLRYEDFLPVSAAGIFASNLGQYGTKSTATERPTYSKKMLEDIMGKKIIDADVIYRGLEAESVKETYAQLGLWEKLAAVEKGKIEQAIAAKQSVLVK